MGLKFASLGFGRPHGEFRRHTGFVHQQFARSSNWMSPRGALLDQVISLASEKERRERYASSSCCHCAVAFTAPLGEREPAIASEEQKIRWRRAGREKCRLRLHQFPRGKKFRL